MRLKLGYRCPESRDSPLIKCYSRQALQVFAPTVVSYRPLAVMSTTSQKHRDFVAEPMADKPVTALAGIGDVLGKKLEEQGFDKAYVVLGQFLVLKKDVELFTEWLKDTCGANTRQAASCTQCLKEWCDAFL
ncbi:barrier-to-autointegration factor-like [Brienomyrus brachyistius]|uniref:barrier-to-autointegration factor-like n=1 Tax=Brienomyrus brachyistius TaxID=42636 RepID=UPI0020B2C3E6|nr:barrier-to-autointegration factor-like [Brienomyrus brachyistius]